MLSMPEESLIERTRRLQADPQTLEDICAHLAEGGSLIVLCKTWNVRYSEMVMWLNADETRKKRFAESLDAQTQWAVTRLLQEIRAISFVDIRQLFNEDHSLKPPSEWPDDVAAAIAGIEVDELYEGVGQERERIGDTKKVKMFDKLKALEMLGKDLGRFVQKHEVTGKLTLEELVTGSNKNDGK